VARIEAIRETYALDAGHGYAGRIAATADTNEASGVTAAEAAELLRKDRL